MNTEQTTEGRRSPTRYSVADRERLLNEHARSGETKRVFCEQRGIALQTFYGWRMGGQVRGPRFAEVQLARPVQAAVEVLLPNGTRVGIHHQGQREDLVALVRGVAGC